MGYNTPALFLNDAVDQIAKDRDLGEKIAQAMTNVTIMPRLPQTRPSRVDLSVGNHGNAVSILPPQHSNDHSLLHLHGNLMTRQVSFFGGKYDDPELTLRAAAATLGFKLVRNNPRKG